MKKNKKKTNSYIKTGLILLGCVLAGALIGFGVAFVDIRAWGNTVNIFLDFIRENLLCTLSLLLILMAILGEFSLRKIKKLGVQMQQADDEVCDEIDYQLERASGIGMVIQNIFTVLSIAALATGYSMDYIARLSTEANNLLLISFIIFIVGCFYEGYWQVRFVKLNQRIDPNKKGDPTSIKFQEQWLESCDEAEREIIYKSAYKTYIAMSKAIPVMMLVTMLAHLLWDTGLMAILIVGIVWVIQTVIYVHTCIKLKVVR